MRVRNVHERVLHATMDEAAPLIDRLGQRDDLVFTTPHWPQMTLDGPLAEGTRGGHGPMRYAVKSYEPGKAALFEVDEGVGIRGTHGFALERLDDDRTILRHTVDGELEGRMRLTWPLAVRPIHDAMVEDLLDQAERAIGSEPRRRPGWSPWVRALRSITGPRARRTQPPSQPLERPDFVDAHEISCRKGMPDARAWAHALFNDFPPWVVGAMAVRQAAAGLVGIERQTKSQAFKTYAETPAEVVLGSDAKHLDFRVSVKREPERVVVTTAVQVHNARGRAYWFVVGPIHPAVIRAMLNRTARRLASHH